jgi:hypothetical protein
VNQHGDIQPIGGATPKIEGFFELCQTRGLTGDQGVIIPAQNVRHLMLRPEVVEAVREARFHIYAIHSIDEGIAILTGLTAGEPDQEGNYAEGTVYHAVVQQIKKAAQKTKKKKEKDEENNETNASDVSESPTPEDEGPGAKKPLLPPTSDQPPLKSLGAKRVGVG